MRKVACELRLYGRLRRFAGSSHPGSESVVMVEIQGPTPLRDVLRRVGIGPAEVSVIFINGRYEPSPMEAWVADGDRVGAFPRDMGLLYV